MPIDLEAIAAAIDGAAQNNQKVAMFHLQVLVHAEELEDYDPKGFCTEIGAPQPYATEFRKMIALHKLMREHGIQLQE